MGLIFAQFSDRLLFSNSQTYFCLQGCEWCNDPDPAPTGFPIGANRNNIALGCIKANGACKDVKQRFLLIVLKICYYTWSNITGTAINIDSYIIFYCSTIPESNQNRDQSIKQDINRLSESDRSQLAPRLLNRFGPVKINPTQGI